VPLQIVTPHNVTPQNVTPQKVTCNKTSPHKTSPATKKKKKRHLPQNVTSHKTSPPTKRHLYKTSPVTKRHLIVVRTMRNNKCPDIIAVVTMRNPPVYVDKSATMKQYKKRQTFTTQQFVMTIGYYVNIYNIYDSDRLLCNNLSRLSCNNTVYIVPCNNMSMTVVGYYATIYHSYQQSPRSSKIVSNGYHILQSAQGLCPEENGPEGLV
jgi:hypothetical protein